MSRALVGKAEKKIRSAAQHSNVRQCLNLPQFETALVIAIGLALTDAMMVLRGPTVANSAVTLFSSWMLDASGW